MLPLDDRQPRFTASIGLVCPDHNRSRIEHELREETDDEDRTRDRTNEARNDANQAKISKVCRIALQVEISRSQAASIGNSYQQESRLMLENGASVHSHLAKPKPISAGTR